LLSELNIRGFFSVIRAHFSLYKDFESLRAKREMQSALVDRKIHAETLNASVIAQFYLKGKKQFNQLEF
jgi:hypothetical protein